MFLLLYVAFFCFCNNAIASDRPHFIGGNNLIAKVDCDPSSSRLCYAANELIDICKELGIENCAYNTPFLELDDCVGYCIMGHRRETEQQLIPEPIRHLKELPITVFQNEDGSFKEQGAILCTLQYLSPNSELFTVTLTLKNNRDFANLIYHFKNKPNQFHIRVPQWICDFKNISNYTIEQSLIQQQIVDTNGNHGPNGYFKKENEQQKHCSSDSLEKIKRSQLFKDLIKDGAIGAAILLFFFLVDTFTNPSGHY